MNNFVVHSNESVCIKSGSLGPDQVYYPRVSETQFRKKGELYLMRYKLIGSYDGTENNPKMYLLNVYQRDNIPAIEEKHAEISEGGRFKLVAVNQEDGAGPQKDAVYQQEILEEFHQRDQILFNQPRQSPVNNTKNTRLIPIRSNHVPNNQDFSFGVQLLTVERLYETVKNVF